MKELAKMFYNLKEDSLNQLSDFGKKLVLNEECKKILNELCIECDKEPFVLNLEMFLGTLYSLRFYYEQTGNKDKQEQVDKLVNRTKIFILYQSLNVDNAGKDTDIQDNYRN